MGHKHQHGRRLQHDHGPQHGIQEQHEPQISPWCLVSAQITCINATPSSSMSHGHQYGFRKWHRPPISTWPLVVCEWAMNINKGPGYSKTMDQNFKKIKIKKSRDPPHTHTHTKAKKKKPYKTTKLETPIYKKRSVKQMSKQSNVRQKCLQKYQLVVLCWLYTVGYGVYPYV